MFTTISHPVIPASLLKLYLPSPGGSVAVTRQFASQPSRALPRRASTSKHPEKPAIRKEASPRDERSDRRYALVDRPDVTEGHARPSQRPFGVSRAVEMLLQHGKLADAEKMVESAPLSSQSTVVWTLLAKHALEEERPNEAWTIFQKMKRRGFQPTARTYATLFQGYSNLPEITEKQWGRIRELWNQYQELLQRLKEAPSSIPPGEQILAPYTPYIDLLGRMEAFDELLSIMSSLEDHGALAPDKYVYTSLLQQLARRGNGFHDARRASQIAFLADKMSSRGLIDSFALTIIVRGLMSGTPQHHDKAFGLVTQLIGDLSVQKTFHKPGMPLEHRLLDHILELCVCLKKYNLVLDMFEHIKTSPITRHMLTRSHIHHILDSISLLARVPYPTMPTLFTEVPVDLSGRALRILEYAIRSAYGGHPLDILPNRATYNRVLVTAWKGEDWTTALRVFEIMTGFDLQHITDPRSNPRAKAPSKSPDKIVLPDAQSISYLARTAKSVTEMKIAVRIFDHFGGAQALLSAPSKDVNYYRATAASTLQGIVIRLMDEPLRQEERKALKDLLEEIKAAKRWTPPQRRESRRY